MPRSSISTPNTTAERPLKFNAETDIDALELMARAKAEAAEIADSPTKSHGRPFSDVFATCMRGQAAELFLIHHCGFADDPRPFRDVLEPDGTPAEVKVTECEAYVRDLIRDTCYEAKIRGYTPPFPNRVYVFLNSAVKKSTDYIFHGTFDWDAERKRFIPSQSPWI